MGVDKHRRAVRHKGPVTHDGVTTLTGNATFNGTPGVVLNNANTVVGTADLGAVNGGLVARLGGTGSPALAFRFNGTVYAMHFLAAGGAVTGTPFT